MAKMRISPELKKLIEKYAGICRPFGTGEGDNKQV